MMYWQSSHWLLQWSCSMSLIISLTGSKLMTVMMTQICGLILVCQLFYCCNMSMHVQKVVNYFISFFLILKSLNELVSDDTTFFPLSYFEQISCCLVTPSQLVFSTLLIHQYILLEWVSLSSMIISIPVCYWNLGCSWLLCAHTLIHPIQMGFHLEYDHLYLGAIRT